MADAYPDEHWEAVAAHYRANAAAPALVIADQFGVPTATARRWIARVRADGLIPKTSHGRTSEQHERITRIASDLGVERHELARVILRHIPNGKVYINAGDAENPAEAAKASADGEANT